MRSQLLTARRLRVFSLQPGDDVASEAFEAGVHLLGPQPGWNRPADQVGDAVLGDEGRQLAHAVVGVADHPRLRDARAVALHGLEAAGLGEEARIELAAIALGRAHRGPVAFAVVGDETATDDPHAVAGRISPGRLQRLLPRR